MENIYDGCSQSEKEDILSGLESTFDGQFEKLVEKIEGCEREVDESMVLCSERNEEGMLQNEQKDDQLESKKNQATSKIVQRNLELHLSFEAQQKIQDILDEVRQLSEKEKLLLYLKLPTKTGCLTEESQPIPLSNTRQEQTQAFQWIRSNLEECECSYTLPKHEVYDDYKSYCEGHGANRTLSAPDFGKIIKCVFPKVKARRLGTRGNSKYCYSGLRKRVAKDSSSLSNVNGSTDNEVNNNNNNNNAISDDLTEDQTLSAACNLVCEWANKLLGRVFNTLIDLARFLVGGSYVSTKSMAAFVVMSATESKVRKMSAKLQFRSSSTTPKSKSTSAARSQSPIDVSALGSIERSPAHAQSLPNSNHIQSKNVFAANGYQIGSTNERPRSLPGLQVATGSQESPKLSNLMSPPVYPPPKSANQLTKGIIPAGGSTVYPDIGCQSRGVSSTFPQGTSPTSFPVLIQQSPQQIPGLQGQAALSSPIQESHSKRQILAQRISLKRSDSCPYPSQSPRSRQMPAAQVMSPTTTTQQHSNTATPDIIRSQNWQGAIGNHQKVLVTSPDSSIQSPRDLNKIIHQQKQQQQQMISPIRGSAIFDTMVTPMGRQASLQRCHSVPAPFNSPQCEVYQPLTPQHRTQSSMTPIIANDSPSFNHIKETRAKFFNTEMQPNARRNLTPSFLNENETSKMKLFKVSVNDRKTDSEHGGVSTNEAAERKTAINNERVPGELQNGGKCYGTRTGNVMLPHQSAGNGSLSNRKQNGGLFDEPTLTAVDSLIDSTFSLVATDVAAAASNGNELNDLDGLDDAETMDLLRSLNSGNNIWVNEWNSGVQLMESSS